MPVIAWSPRQLATAGVVVLIAVAVWARFAFIVMYGGLEASYHAWAMSNYFGAITGTYLGSADALQATWRFPTLGYPPGYPLILLITRSLGFQDPQDFRHLQAVVDAAIGVPAVYRLARAAGTDRWLALMGGGFYAVYPLFAVGAGLVLGEALSPLMLVIILCAALWARRSATIWRIGALGLLMGAAALVRPELVLLAPAVAVWLWTAGGVRRRADLAAALAGGVLIALLPWAVHNRAVHGAWVFTSTGGSVGLWEGLGAVENPYGYVLNDDYTAKMLADRGLAWYSIEADRFLRQEYLRAWREHPEFVIRVAWYRWRHILWWSEEFRTAAFFRLQKILNHYGALLCAAALVLASRNAAVWLVVALPVAYALFTIGLVHYEPRYVRYVHLSYALAGLIALARTLDLLESRRWRRAIVMVPVTAVVALYAADEIQVLQDEVRAVERQKEGP